MQKVSFLSLCGEGNKAKSYMGTEQGKRRSIEVKLRREKQRIREPSKYTSHIFPRSTKYSDYYYQHKLQLPKKLVFRFLCSKVLLEEEKSLYHLITSFQERSSSIRNTVYLHPFISSYCVQLTQILNKKRHLFLKGPK